MIAPDSDAKRASRGATRQGAMLTGADTRAKLQAILDVAVKGMSERATGAATSTTQRLAAIDGLMRVAEGPKKRPSDPTDIARGHDARAALSRAAPFLQQMATSHTTARVRARAAKLVIRIGQLEPTDIGDAVSPKVSLL